MLRDKIVLYLQYNLERAVPDSENKIYVTDVGEGMYSFPTFVMPHKLEFIEQFKCGTRP